MSGKVVAIVNTDSEGFNLRRPLFLLAAILLLSGCATTPPARLDNLCEIFREKGDWFDDANDAFKKWGVPVHVQMAIIHQESRFRSDAQPPRDWFLFIPLGRPSTAYGYAQALDTTWDWYVRESGNWGADRDDFEDATDFIGWYASLTHRKLGVSKWDAGKQYLAYHEGQGGYQRGTYRKKPWLQKVAAKVDRRAKRYRGQLASCRDEFETSWWR